jgi:hypothetical protein
VVGVVLYEETTISSSTNVSMYDVLLTNGSNTVTQKASDIFCILSYTSLQGPNVFI